MSVVERYNCSAEPSTNHNEKQYGRLYFGKELRWRKSHVRQCTVLQDGNGDLFPGAIMEVAEQLVEKGSKATVQTQEDMDWQAEKAKECLRHLRPFALTASCPLPKRAAAAAAGRAAGKGWKMSAALAAAALATRSLHLRKSPILTNLVTPPGG